MKERRLDALNRSAKPAKPKSSINPVDINKMSTDEISKYLKLRISQAPQTDVKSVEDD
jgi:hypothetical protein